MKILVTYKSKTDFTKRYAEMIAKEVNCDLIDFKKVTAEIMESYDVVVFGGGLYAGMINGLKKAKIMLGNGSAKNFVVFATGATPNNAEEVIDTMWKNNLSEEELASVPHFYMQSGICYDKMSLPHKAILKMLSFMLSKQKNKANVDEGFEQSLKGSFDVSSKKHAEPLIKYLLELS